MTPKTLMKDPLNLIVIGAAGQGNVQISLLIGDTLVREGYLVTFGQTYGATQRGGTVTNYVRISKEVQCSPIVPEGRADIILALEPVEAMRMLRRYGNPNVITIINSRPIHPIDITGGQAEYPELDELLDAIKRLSAKAWVINATEEAQRLGDPILANVILTGALIGSGTVPLDEKSVEPLLQERFPKAFELNMAAFSRGIELVSQ
ncbi:MAG: indolepyruvate oxidoreductase subunit beta [Dehalococcoidia bacterium]